MGHRQYIAKHPKVKKNDAYFNKTFSYQKKSKNTSKYEEKQKDKSNKNIKKIEILFNDETTSFMSLSLNNRKKFLVNNYNFYEIKFFQKKFVLEELYTYQNICILGDIKYICNYSQKVINLIENILYLFDNKKDILNFIVDYDIKYITKNISILKKFDFSDKFINFYENYNNFFDLHHIIDHWIGNVDGTLEMMIYDKNSIIKEIMKNTNKISLEPLIAYVNKINVIPFINIKQHLITIPKIKSIVYNFIENMDFTYCYKIEDVLFLCEIFNLDLPTCIYKFLACKFTLEKQIDRFIDYFTKNLRYIKGSKGVHHSYIVKENEIQYDNYIIEYDDFYNFIDEYYNFEKNVQESNNAIISYGLKNTRKRNYETSFIIKIFDKFIKKNNQLFFIELKNNIKNFYTFSMSTFLNIIRDVPLLETQKVYLLKLILNKNISSSNIDFINDNFPDILILLLDNIMDAYYYNSVKSINILSIKINDVIDHFKDKEKIIKFLKMINKNKHYLSEIKIRTKLDHEIYKYLKENISSNDFNHYPDEINIRYKIKDNTIPCYLYHYSNEIDNIFYKISNKSGGIGIMPTEYRSPRQLFYLGPRSRSSESILIKHRNNNNNLVMEFINTYGY